MLLCDEENRSLIEAGVLVKATDSAVGLVSYDLTTSAFFDENGSHASYALGPGQSEFMGTFVSQPPAMI